MTGTTLPNGVELAICGGGLAGLSLAIALSELGEACPRTHLVEARHAYKRDRTWSYWRLHDHPFDAAVRSRWSRCLVRGGGRDVHFNADPTPYETIEAHTLYDMALERLRGHPKITMSLGVPVDALTEDGGAVAVETPAGRMSADLCVDTRPPVWVRPEDTEILPQGLVQAFAGIEIETEEPCFDPGEVILMDFLPGTHEGEIRFFYVLPFSPTRALVEDTRFTPRAHVPPPLEGLEEAVARYVGHPFTVHYREAACLPMISAVGMDPSAPGSRILRMGTAGGALRPSSGYGFLAIQRQAAALAQGITRHGLAAEALRPGLGTRTAWLSAMDKVWLRVLRHHPHLGPLLSAVIFEKADTQRAIRFLADTGSLIDAAAVVMSLPKLPFLKTAASLALGLKEFGIRPAPPNAPPVGGA